MKECGCVLIKLYLQPWPVRLKRLEHHPVTQRLQFHFPVRAHTYIGGSIPGPGAYDPQPRHVLEATNRCFSLTSMFLFLLSSPLKSNEKMSSGKERKKKNLYLQNHTDGRICPTSYSFQTLFQTSARG